MNTRGKPTRGGPHAWGLGKVLTTPQCKTWPCYETDTCATCMDWFFVM